MENSTRVLFKSLGANEYSELLIALVSLASLSHQ